MIKSLFHNLWGHTWIGMSWCFNPPLMKSSGGYWIDTDDKRMTLYGFTQVVFICGCGTTKDIRLIGKQEPKEIKK